ncbi:MAG: type II secretion system protein [Candidatus Scalindua sp.]|jgi:type II secretory pathway pseudopilin PulG|nr:type II secretion system protein [Candidatus Scalindua sp.]
MKINLFRNRIWNLKSERGFTLTELIMIVTVTGILSSTLVIPFTTGIKQATRPEIYATATYLAQEKIEELRSSGYTTTSGILGTTSVNVTKKGRVYTEQVVTEYVSHSAGSFSAEASSTEYIRATITVSNTTIPDDIVLWTILAKDFYDPDPV